MPHPIDPVDVVLVDDHPLFAEGVELLLAEAAPERVRVVGRTTSASMAVGLVRRTRPHVALVDLAMPPPGGRDAVRALKRAEPSVRVVVLSGVTDDDEVVAALAAGADGFLPKTADPADLVAPLVAAAAGWAVMPRSLASALVEQAGRGRRHPPPGLDDDDLALWRLVASGAGSDVIAERCMVSERTAKRLVAGLLRRLGVASRVEAAALAGRAGILDD